MLAAATHALCIVHVFNAGRSKIQAVAGPKSRCFGPDPVLDFSRNRLHRHHRQRKKSPIKRQNELCNPTPTASKVK